MNGNDLLDLSYRDLQALAAKYRVPGNIKKHLLVRVLQAILGGDKTEVDQMLLEVQQTRKKRMKKQTPNILMNVSSTPIHSPNYAESEVRYYSRHQPPYQWVGAEEEIKEDDSMRVPNYDEFQQFLLHRIQTDYQSYNLNESDGAPSIVDLRMGAGTSMLRATMIDTNNGASNILMHKNTYIRPPSRNMELQVLEDDGSNTRGPMLLKKMLEAPLGANLGDIASPDTNSNKIWSIEQYPNNSGDPLLDDSDTLTADSDIDENVGWNNEDDNDNDNNNNNNNHNNNINVDNDYCTMNDNKKLLYNDRHDLLNNSLHCLQNISQLQNNFPNDDNQCQRVYSVSDDAQANCQKWVATNTFFSRDTNYNEHTMDDSRSNRPFYYENASGNPTINKSINSERKCQQDVPNVHYEANHINIHEPRSDWSCNEHHQYYHGYNVVGPDTSTFDPNAGYYLQQIAPNNNNNNNTVQNAFHANLQSEPSVQFTDDDYGKQIADNFHQHNQQANNGMQYNAASYYTYYPNENNQQMAAFSNLENSQRQQQQQHQPQQQQQTSMVAVQKPDVRKNIPQSAAIQANSNEILGTFWPRRQINETVTSGGQLESILNLQNHRNVIDHSKDKQTAYVYCNTEPVVTQMIEASHNWSAQKGSVAKGRQHLFSANWLVYNDASTGMIMANLDKSSEVMVNHVASNNEPLTSSTEPISERRASTESSENSINDVWIHDYSKYPVGSDNVLQTVDLTNDPTNNDDLFSTVRPASENSIHDHMIETFTNMGY